MKSVNPSIIRGLDAEERLVRVVESLGSEGHLPIRRIQRANWRQDQIGIDFIITLEQGKAKKRVPIQVKSSVYGIYKFREQYPEYVSLGIMIVLVNERLTNEELKDIIELRLLMVLIFQQTFEDFWEHISKRLQRRKDKPGTLGKETGRSRIVMNERLRTEIEYCRAEADSYLNLLKKLAQKCRA